MSLAGGLGTVAGAALAENRRQAPAAPRGHGHAAEASGTATSCSTPPSGATTAVAPAATGAGHGAAALTLDGFTFSHTQVARLMARVAAVPDWMSPAS